MSTDNQQEGSGSGSQAMPVAFPPPPVPLNCPRCGSTNTKFCYYNNYNSRQPRHFCRACRRYWTQGGTLRNIPIGSGNRKGKKTSAGSSSSSRVSSDDSNEPSADIAIDRFKYFGGQELQLGSLSKFPSVHGISANLSVPAVGGQLVSALGNIPTPPVASTAVTDQRLDQLGDQDGGFYGDQDLGWILEEEGLNMMYLDGGDRINDYFYQQDDMLGPTNHDQLVETQQPQPSLEMPPNYDSRNVNAAKFSSTDPQNYGYNSAYNAPVVDQVPSSGSQTWTNFGHSPAMP